MTCLSACEQTPDSSKPAAAVKPTILTALVWAPDWPDQMHEIAAAFTRLHPEIQVDVQFMIGNSVEENLKPKIASNNLPDIFSVNPNRYTAELADQGLLADLGDTAAWDNMHDFLKADWTSRQRQRFGIAGGVATTLIYYNRDLFARAGISTPPTDFDAFLNSCTMLKKAGITPLALSGGFPNMLANGPFSSGFSNNIAAAVPDWKARIANGSLALDTPQAADIFARMKLLAERGCLQKNYMQTGYDEALRLFVDGKAAMTFQGSWAAGTLLRDKKFQSGIFMPPWNDAGRQPVPVIGSETGFAVGETRNKQAALLFLDFLYGPGFVIEQNKRQNIPPLKQLAGPAVVDQQIFDYVSRLENTEVSAGPYYSYLPSGTIDLLHPLLQDVLFGKKSPQQAAQILNQSLRDQAHTNNK